MVNPVDRIAQQAHQGSVAAIIQVLNEQLADSGVRIRAVFEDGMLQLLCEANQAEQLEQSTLVQRIREILESISPRNIRRVNINSRLVREQQLLWLEEIRRDPANQLLWSQKIAIAQPNFLRKIVASWQSLQSQRHQIVLPKTLTDSPHQRRRNNHFGQGLLGGISLSLALLFLGGWVYRHWFAPHRVSQSDTEISVVVTPTVVDSFAEAVALAEQASVDGQTAQTTAQWLELAAKWQKAADLMAQVLPGDPRYQTARDRSQQYARNSQETQFRAEQLRNP
jgi:hypothetical protein